MIFNICPIPAKYTLSFIVLQFSELYFSIQKPFHFACPKKRLFLYHRRARAQALLSLLHRVADVFARSFLLVVEDIRRVFGMVLKP